MDGLHFRWYWCELEKGCRLDFQILLKLRQVCPHLWYQFCKGGVHHSIQVGYNLKWIQRKLHGWCQGNQMWQINLKLRQVSVLLKTGSPITILFKLVVIWNESREKCKVSLLGVVALWGDCTFILADLAL